MERDERATLSALLRYQRESFLRSVAGLDDDAARREFVGSGTTLLWLTKHLVRAELLWVLRRFAGADVDIPRRRGAPGGHVGRRRPGLPQRLAPG